MSRRVLIVGCGYIGSQLAVMERESGADVTALVRTDDSAQALQRMGVNAIAKDVDDVASDLPVCSSKVDVLYYLLAPPSQGKVDTRSERFVRHCHNAQLGHIVLLSTTGVYGDCGGAWIDEGAPVRPVADRAHRRVHAESTWLAAADANRWGLTCLRVAGIYGPGKLPVERLRRQDPVLALAESPWSNRIYSKDLVRICQAASQAAYPGVINVVDDEPSSISAYFMAVADCLGLPTPVEIRLDEAKARMSAGLLSYLRESRRIRNDKLKQVLGIQLSYPTLALGLADIVQSPSAEKI